MQEQRPERPAGRVSRLSEIRRRRKRRRVRIAVAATLVVAAVLAYMAGLYGSAMASLGDIVDTVRIALTPGEGFPVRTGISELYQLEELSGGFVALGKQDLVLFSSTGRQLRSIQHGYARPGLAAGNTRFCLYSRGGRELRVESRSQTLYTDTLLNDILLCDMSNNGSLAVATVSSRYTAELTVYSPSFQFRYGWNMTDREGTPIALCFSPDNRRLAVGGLRAQDGALESGIYLLNLNSDQVAVSFMAPGSLLMHLAWLDGNRLMAVYSDFAAVYDMAGGVQTARYDFGAGQQVLGVSTSGKNTAVLLSTGGLDEECRLLVLGDDLNPLADTTLLGGNRVVCTRTAAYILTNSSVLCYTLAGEEQWQLSTQPPPLAVLQAKQLLLFTAERAQVLEKPQPAPEPTERPEQGGAAE